MFQAIAAKSGQIHQLDVLHLGMRLQMRHEAPKGPRRRLIVEFRFHLQPPRALGRHPSMAGRPRSAASFERIVLRQAAKP